MDPNPNPNPRGKINNSMQSQNQEPEENSKEEDLRMVDSWIVSPERIEPKANTEDDFQNRVDSVIVEQEANSSAEKLPSVEIIGNPNRWWGIDQTMALLDAHWERYQQKIIMEKFTLDSSDWEYIIDAVNQLGCEKNRVQCKNKLMALKKQYKSATDPSSLATTWPYFEKVKRIVDATS